MKVKKSWTEKALAISEMFLPKATKEVEETKSTKEVEETKSTDTAIAPYVQKYHEIRVENEYIKAEYE